MLPLLLLERWRNNERPITFSVRQICHDNTKQQPKLSPAHAGKLRRVHNQDLCQNCRPAARIKVHHQDLQVHNHEQRSAAPESKGAQPGSQGAQPGSTQCGSQDPQSGPAELELATPKPKGTQPGSQGAQPGSTQCGSRRKRSLCMSSQIIVQSGQPEPLIVDEFARA